MARTLLCTVALALALVPVARPDGGPSPGVALGGEGILDTDSGIRYVTTESGSRTHLLSIRARDGIVLRWTTLPGRLGVPIVTYDGTAGGLSTNRKVLVLAAPSYVMQSARSRFVLLSPRSMRWLGSVELKGTFSFDAISPNGRMLYLVQHLTATNFTRYAVRAYDLAADRLLPGRVADPAQRGWVMQGTPAARVTSASGRWVYTLYLNGREYPFVHALDTVRAKARCIGLPWAPGEEEPARLALDSGGKVLAVRSGAGRTLFAIDTRTHRLAKTPDGLSWWATGLAAIVAVPAGTLLLRGRLRRRH